MARKKRIKIMDTSFRDGFQSVYGARVLTKDFLPALEAAKNSGIGHFEVGGGARFQALYFYCNEDAFDMMDAVRKVAGPDANLQTLARGINVVGLESQSSDIIKLHAKLFKKHGMTTIRNFDALNDVNNLMYSGRCIVEAGLNHEVCVTMMELPPGCKGAHTPAFYAGVLKKILDEDIPFTSVCFKDASGTSVPAKVFDTIQLARKMVPKGTHIHFHTHSTAGIAVMAYKAALDGGADGIDLAMAPVSGGTCSPDIVTMWHALRGTEFDLGVDIDRVLEAEEVFKRCMADYFVPPEARAVEPMIPFSPMPGGALTANTQMMRDNGTLDRYPEVIRAMKEVVERGGYGTSVTPVSQFYFQQAYSNVMFGPWQKIAEGYGKMVLGYFGKTPVPPDKEIVKIASEQLNLEPATLSPLEINDSDPGKGILAARRMLQAEGIEETDENIFIAATCREKGIAFLKGGAKLGIRKNISVKKEQASSGKGGYTVSVDNKRYQVSIHGDQAVVNGRTYSFNVEEGTPTEDSAAEAHKHGEQTVTAPLPGSVVKINVKVGDAVIAGKPLMVLEAMKMETEVTSPVEGVVSSIKVSVGDQVPAGLVIASIN